MVSERSNARQLCWVGLALAPRLPARQAAGLARVLAACSLVAAWPRLPPCIARRRDGAAPTHAAWPSKHACKPLCTPLRLAQFPRNKVLNETAAVLAAVRAAYPSVKKIGAQG